MTARGFDGSMPMIDAPLVARTRWELAALHAHRLELPYGFDPRNVDRPRTGDTRSDPDEVTGGRF